MSKTVEEIVKQFDDDFHDYYNGKWNFNGKEPVEIAIEAINQLLIEAKIEALNSLYGSTLLDTQVLAADMGENELQSYMAGYKTGWREASQLIEDHVSELQSTLKPTTGKEQ